MVWPHARVGPSWRSCSGRVRERGYRTCYVRDFWASSECKSLAYHLEAARQTCCAVGNF